MVGADVPGGPRPRDVPVRAAWTSPCARHGRPPARGAPRTSRPTSRRIPAPRRGGTGAWRPRGVCGRGRRPRRPASPERPRARMDVPVRAACASPCARRAEDVAPYQPRIPAPVGAARAHGGHGDICGRGRRPRRPASPGRPHACSADVPCARRAEDVAPYQSAHPVPLCRETLRPPGRCGHERTAARCAILFGLRGTDERGRVPVRGVHHGTAKRRKPKRPCV